MKLEWNLSVAVSFGFSKIIQSVLLSVCNDHSSCNTNVLFRFNRSMKLE